LGEPGLDSGPLQKGKTAANSLANFSRGGKRKSTSGTKGPGAPGLRGGGGGGKKKNAKCVSPSHRKKKVSEDPLREDKGERGKRTVVMDS